MEHSGVEPLSAQLIFKAYITGFTHCWDGRSLTFMFYLQFHHSICRLMEKSTWAFHSTCSRYAYAAALQVARGVIETVLPVSCLLFQSTTACLSLLSWVAVKTRMPHVSSCQRKTPKVCCVSTRLRGLCCGKGTRTPDLWVMNPTSCHCSIPRCIARANV